MFELGGRTMTPKKKDSKTPKKTTKKEIVEQTPVSESVAQANETTEPKKKSNTGKRLVILLVFAVLFFGLGGYFLFKAIFGGGSEKDVDAPELALVSPTSDEWYSTSEEKITLEGAAIDPSGVEKVEIEIDGEKSSAKVEEDTTWQSEELELKEGDNKITLKTQDKKGNKTETTLNVVFNKDIAFNVKLSQDYVYKNETANITVNAEVSVKDDKKLDEVTLYEVKDGDTDKKAEMKDDGSTLSGDDVPEDSIYSVKEDFKGENDGKIELRVGGKVEGESDVVYSGIVVINVLNKPSESDLQGNLDIQKDLNKKFDDLKENKNAKATAEALLAYINKEKKDEIEVAGISENGTGVWWQYKNTGILGGVSNFDEEIRSGGQGDGQGSNKALVSKSSVKSSYGFVSTAEAAKKKNEPEVQNTKALYLGPYLHQFKETDDYHDGWKTIKDSKCPKCETTEKKDAEVTVQDFKGLDKYGIVMIISHGDTWFNGEMKSTAKGTQVITYTYQEVTLDNMLENLPDLLSNKLAIGYNNHYVVLPGYIKAYNSKFPNSLVYMGTCRGAYNGTMASAFISRGAKTYIGFTQYVNSKYAKDVAGEFFKSFIEKGKTTSESFGEAVAAKGKSDNNTPKAFFRMFGANNLKMGGQNVQNTGFEEGLTGWGYEGDARVIPRLGSLKAQEGKRMAIISTGLGSVSDSNSVLTQTICSKEGKLKLGFKYNFVSEEPMEYVGSSYDDELIVTVSINGSAKTIVNRTINNSSWSAIGGINFAGGDETTFQTGWASISEDLGEIKKDDVVVIEFRVKDKGDSIYDSAALIDAVTVDFE